MLGIWRDHAEYLFFAENALAVIAASNPQVVKKLEHSILKMLRMNLDVVKTELAGRFSLTGRPSNQQPEIFRAFVLMCDQKDSNIDHWCILGASNPLFCTLVGVEPKDFPKASTMRDFISRLWLGGELNHVKTVESKPKEKFGKEKKPPKNQGIIKELTDKALAGETFCDIPEALLQRVFAKVAVQTSIDASLVEKPNKLTVSADGTCVESHSNPNGHHTDDPTKRRFADPLARWLWDSYHERYFSGYMAYFMSTYNSALKLNLPLYLRFAQTSSFDGVTFIEALSHFRSLYDGVMSIDSVLADSAHDNYATYSLLRDWHIKPFIDLNKRNPQEPKPQNLLLSKRGVPICADGYEMSNWGYEANKARIKYRCPLVTGAVKYCPFAENCNKSDYGKIVYVRLNENLRLLTPVPRGSDEWNETYKQRTATERVNNRILTDYQLEQPKRYGKKKLAFFAFINAINVHLDAQVRHGGKNLGNFLAA